MTDFEIAGAKIPMGSRKSINIKVGKLYDSTDLAIPVEVVRGKEDGPVLFVSAAIHGDEVGGVEIIRRLIQSKWLRYIRGVLIAVPIVNVYGFNNRSRYLPDRRDLNRCFPGSGRGSLASQIAHIFMEEVVKKSSHGIDLHTAAVHRVNLPQIRASLDHEETRKLALAFGAPVVLDSNLRDGSLRQAALELDIPILLFEAGEALRFDEVAIKIGLRGILDVMAEIGMLSRNWGRIVKPAFIATSSYWIRAPIAGIMKHQRKLGSYFKAGDVIAVVSDPAGRVKTEVTVPQEGVVVGETTLPLVNQGDAMFHIASFDEGKHMRDKLVDIHEPLDWAYSI
jgi:predicted deacylase